MKATAITVTHRKEKDVDIYTATNNAYEVDVQYIAHIGIKTAKIINQEKANQDPRHPKDILDPFFTAIQQFKNKQNANDHNNTAAKL